MSSFLLNSYIILPSGLITITSQPSSRYVLANTSTTFTIAASTVNGTLGYQWRRNGLNIHFANSSSFTASESAVGSYNYDCVVTNLTFSNSVTSNTAVLTVYEPFVFTINTSLLS